MKSIRIGGASGYWGDTASAPRQLVDKGAVDYLVFDYLAEVTMSILAKLHQRSPEAGFAHDFITMMKPLIGKIAEKRIKVIANAGGVNLAACAKALAQIAAEAGVTLRIGTVDGDNLMPRLAELRPSIREMQTGKPLPEKILSANAYLGAFPIAVALDTGADIVITGRCVDSALVLGPMIHAFRWQATDYDKLAAGSLAGHLLECGAQATGGNFTDWQDVEAGWEDMGFPIAEASPDGSFVITKPADTGGLVSPLSVGEQLLYEIGDPASYVLPDVVCDFTQVRLTHDGKDRVRVEGARGRPPTATYKVSATWPGGYAAAGAMVVAGFDAAARAQRNGEAILTKCRRMLADAGLSDFRRTSINVIGADTLYGGGASQSREVVLRIAIHHDRNEGAELFSKEYVGSGLSMATGRCGLGAGRPNVSPVVRLFSFLIEKDKVPVKVKVDGADVPYSAPAMSYSENLPKVASEHAEPAEALPPGRRIEVPLVKLAVARSGDKGNDANIGVMARKPEYLPAIRAALTPAAVKRHFAHLAEGPVERFELPGLNALNFVLHDSLGGGGTSSVNLDTQGKTYAQVLLALPVPVPEAWGNELGVAG